jgi:hypothetical protein
MDHLRNVMRIIDEHSDKLPEGAYLEVCKNLQTAYREKNKRDMMTLIDYENFEVLLDDQPDDVLDHFYDYYYNISLINDESFLLAQKRYLQVELDSNEPVRRTTKAIKVEAIKQYCMLHNITLFKYDEEHLRMHLDQCGCDLGDIGTSFDKGIKNLYKSYVALENTYRHTYSSAVKKRLNIINGWLENLGGM